MNNYNQLNDKIKGCLFGGAIGDALGYPVEFISHPEIVSKYGDHGIQQYEFNIPCEKGKFKEAQISDDTQMTLYTAEAILKNPDSKEEVLENIKKAYVVWMCKQTGVQPKVEIDLDIAKIDALNQRRAPGATCISALESINYGNEVYNDSKGCGAVMRIAPIGILSALKGWNTGRTEDFFHNSTMKFAGEVAEITHHHELSTYSSAICAEIIRECLLEEQIDLVKFKEIIERALFILPTSFHGVDFYLAAFEKQIKNVFNYIDDPREDWQIIESNLGGGWIAEEALAIALFCVARHINDFRACMVSAVNHSGDSDSTGAIAGNILGAILGYKNIPESFLTKLQNKNYIERIANNLFAIKLEIVNIQDLKDYGIKYWVEASGFIEKRLIEYGAFMIPNNLVQLLLKVSSNELILLDNDQYHFTKLEGNGTSYTKMLFGIRDITEFNSYNSKIDESEGFVEYAEKKFENNNEKDLTKKAIFIIENIYRCNEEDEFHELLPHWESLLTESREILLKYDKDNTYIPEANYLLERMPTLKLMELSLLNE